MAELDLNPGLYNCNISALSSHDIQRASRGNVDIPGTFLTHCFRKAPSKAESWVAGAADAWRSVLKFLEARDREMSGGGVEIGDQQLTFLRWVCMKIFQVHGRKAA